jgi:hypothetical protein
VSPKTQDLDGRALNNTPCIWAGHLAVAEAFPQSQLIPFKSLPMGDDDFKRNFVIYDKNEIETWVLACEMLIGLASRVADFDRHVALGVPTKSAWRRRLLHRARYGSFGSMWAPEMQTRCALQEATSSKHDGHSATLWGTCPLARLSG